jgi:hypothetical protein
MKKTLTLLFGLALAVSVSAADLPQLTLQIRTQGPDFYADGQPVTVGETYLLVYVKQNATFQGLRADGSLVDPDNNQVVTTSSAITGEQGSYCAPRQIQYDVADYPANGKWLVVLLDTRKDDGTVGGLIFGFGTNGQATVTAGTGIVPASAGKNASSSTPAGLTTDKLPAVAPAAAAKKPVITGFAREGASVRVDLKDCDASAGYRLESSTDVASGKWQHAARLQKSPQGEPPSRQSVAVPADDAVRFFRVITP